MNEAEIENKPVEDEALLDLNDIIEAEEEETVLFDEAETSELKEEEAEPETLSEDTPVEEVKEEEVDFKPLLDKLSKNIKYMDKEITIDSLEDVIEKYQKG